MSERLPTALIGVGRWGRNIATQLHASSAFTAYASRPGAGPNAWMAEHVGGARHATVEEICADPAICAVAVATPMATHARLARRLLEAGKHVFVEKPLAPTSAEASDLAALAAARGLVLATGYQFLFHPVYAELKRRIDAHALRRATFTWRKYGTFGEPIESNLLTHHLALALDLLGPPRSGSVRCLGRVESDCDAIEAQLIYPNAEVTSLIDRGSRVRSHTMSFDLEDGSAFVWTGARLLFLEEPEGEPEAIFHSEEMPLTIEIARFVEAAAGHGTALPTAGDFGARVLRVQDMLKPLK